LEILITPPKLCCDVVLSGLIQVIDVVYGAASSGGKPSLQPHQRYLTLGGEHEDLQLPRRIKAFSHKKLSCRNP